MISVVEYLYEKYSDRKSLSKKDYLNIFKTILSKVSIPFPNETIEHFAQPGIIHELIIESFNSSKTTIEERRGNHEKLNSLLKLFPNKRTGVEIKLRVLGNKGRYPLEPIKRDKIRYEVFGSRPNLITINKIEAEDEFRNDSWIYWINRLELKFATAIILSAPGRAFFPYFNPYDTVSLNNDYVKKVPENQLVLFLNQWLDIKNSFVRPDGEMFNRVPRPDVSTYNYDKFNPNKSGFYDYFDSFSIRDHLLLRTSNYLLKALMHKVNLLFQEEALLQSFLALEGGLHLLQKKYGDSSTRLNRKLLRDIFQNKISYLPNGEGTYEFIEEGYFTRISLVHPEPDWGAEWNPYVHIGDFREYHGLARLVLSWTLCEKEIDDY